MTRIKICGIKEEEHAAAVAGAGADYLGLVFAPSPRQVTPARAARIVSTLKDSGVSLEVVGVFVNAPSPRVKKIAAACRLDWVQLSGDEPWEYCRELGLPVIKVIRLSRNQKPDKVCADLAYGSRVLGKRQHMFLVDADVADKFGGTGMPFDWDLARPIARRFPVIVAGGLTPENVAAAIEIVSPWGVDVSSGVETGGVKDLRKIRKFIKNVRQTDGQA
ncbi:MAG: phosphoribosylanthranilate isomerase [Chloroflexota bacterium]